MKMLSPISKKIADFSHRLSFKSAFFLFVAIGSFLELLYFATSEIIENKSVYIIIISSTILIFSFNNTVKVRFFQKNSESIALVSAIFIILSIIVLSSPKNNLVNSLNPSGNHSYFFKIYRGTQSIYSGISGIQKDVNQMNSGMDILIEQQKKMSIGIESLRRSVQRNSISPNLQLLASPQMNSSRPFVVRISVKRDVVHGNILQRFVSVGDSRESPYQHQYLSVRGWKVSSVRSQNAEFAEEFSGRKAIIVEGDKGSLYLFENGSFVYWKHTDLGSPTVDQFQILLTHNDGSTSLTSLAVKARVGIEDSKPAQICSHGKSINGSEYSDDLMASCVTGDAVTLYSLGGDDIITGTYKSDRLFAGDGNDVVIGNRGGDYLSGGYGADIFVAATSDYLSGTFSTITDFSCLEGDVLDIRYAIDFDVYRNDLPLNEKLNFVSVVVAFSGDTNAPSEALVFVDPDGDGEKYEAKQLFFLKKIDVSSTTDMLNSGCIDLM